MMNKVLHKIYYRLCLAYLRYFALE